MAASERRRRVLAAAFLGGFLALIGCAAPPTAPYDADAPRNGAGEPVDRVTGLPLPGSGQSGGGGGGGM